MSGAQKLVRFTWWFVVGQFVVSFFASLEHRAILGQQELPHHVELLQLQRGKEHLRRLGRVFLFPWLWPRATWQATQHDQQQTRDACDASSSRASLREW